MSRRALLLLLICSMYALTYGQDTVSLPFHEEWDTYSATYERHVNGWWICKNGINDESVVQRSNLHGYLSTGHTNGSGTTFALPAFNVLADTFTFYIYGSNLMGHSAEVEFGYIPDNINISAPEDVCNNFHPYDTVVLSVNNQWRRTTVAMRTYYEEYEPSHRLAIRLTNNYGQQLYLDEIGGWLHDGAECPEATTECTDFWATFMPNALLMSDGSYDNNAMIGFLASGQNSATITVTNNQLGYSETFNHVGGDETFIQLPTAHWDTSSARPSAMGYHITSTAPIFLYASNYQRSGWDICNLLPSSSLGTNYIVHDYHNTESSASLYAPTSALVATRDNTTIRMVLPCQVAGVPLNIGDTLTMTLNGGESLLLRARTTNSMFNGMRVMSDKPIALFQGHSGAVIGPSGGRDPLFEQARPVEMWGHEFIATSSRSRTEGDVIGITSAGDNCVINLNGTYHATIQSGEFLTYTLPSNSALYIQTTQPCYASIYTWSYNYGTLGDPAMIPIIPVERWVCHADFPIHNCNTNMGDVQRIADDHHFVNIVTATNAAGDLLLDGQSIDDFVDMPSGYSYTRKVVHPGAHTITSSAPFCAHAYGMGKWVGYGFAVTHACDTSECTIQINDTIDYNDTICLGSGYWENGFNVSERETSTAGTIERWWIDDSGTPLHYHHLYLTILPSFAFDTAIYAIEGDTVTFGDTIITDDGDYTFAYMTSDGCDSTITLHVYYKEIDITAEGENICLGDCVEITASGIRHAYWTASPQDTTIESQQGSLSITVCPTQTTTYTFRAVPNGPSLGHYTIKVKVPPIPSYTLSKPFIDYENSNVLFTDISAGSRLSYWEFSDGVLDTSKYSYRSFCSTVSDSVVVKLTTCSMENCCSDTTFSVPVKSRAIWFPNVFTPGENGNNRFGCFTNIEVEEFELYIYNRRGMLAYKSDDITAFWDGTHNGKPCSQETYTYYWRLKDHYGTTKSGVGMVMLLR